MVHGAFQKNCSLTFPLGLSLTFIIFWVNCIVYFRSLEWLKFYILKFENFDFTLQNLVLLAKSYHRFVLNVM